MLDERYSQALAALKEQAQIQSDLEALDYNLDAASPEDAAKFRARMDAVAASMGKYRTECGRIMQIAYDHDDPEFSIAGLTPERLARLLGG